MAAEWAAPPPLASGASYSSRQPTVAKELVVVDSDLDAGPQLLLGSSQGSAGLTQVVAGHSALRPFFGSHRPGIGARTRTTLTL